MRGGHTIGGKTSPTAVAGASPEATPTGKDAVSVLRFEPTVPGLVLCGTVATKRIPSSYARGQEKDRPLKILLDSGASHSIFDNHLAHRMNLARQSPSHTKARLADGRQTILGDDLWAVKLLLGDYKCYQRFKTMSLGDYDVILGRDWLKKNNPNVDWSAWPMRM